MANYFEPTEENRTKWTAWVAERPPLVRVVAERFFPWKLYRMKSTGHRVTVVSFEDHFDDSVTLKVAVTGRFNLVAFERVVFGVDPDDLEECDLPAEGEPVGSAGLPAREVRKRIKKGRLN